MATLNQKKANEIRSLHRKGITSRQLAKHFGVCRKTIMEVVKNKLYKEK